MTNVKRLSLTVVVSSLFAGCAAPPTTSPTVSQSSAIEIADYDSEVQALLRRADIEQPIAAAELKLRAAERLVTKGQPEQAAKVLADVDTSNLPPKLRFDIIRIQTEQALNNQQGEQALSYLAYMPSLSTLPPEDLAISEQLYIDAYQLSGQALEQAHILIDSTQYIQDEAQLRDLHEKIWIALQQVDDAALFAAIQQPNNDYVFQGWLELAAATRANSGSDMDSWLAIWEAHPAALFLPSPLLSSSTPRAGGDAIAANRIGVLLPQSGRLAQAANAIKQGIITAHQAAQQNGFAPELAFIDSSALSTPQAIFDAAAQYNVDMLIGPLDKSKVTELSQMDQLPLPVLALNYADNGAYNLYQYGLSAEDEAKQAAIKAINDGKRIALVLTPDTDWGQRSQQAFIQQFTELGGQIADAASFTAANLNQTIATLLQADQSQARAKQLRKITGLKFEFEERSRQDADVLLLAARAQDARLIKPVMAYYFAGKLPVYATSQIYGGTPNSQRDVDLNGITFGEMPWVMLPPSTIHQQIAAQHSNANSRFGRLYAMGVDAFNLHPYLQQLSNEPNSELPGETGTLSVNPQNQVSRKLVWATFNQGVPQLPSSSDAPTNLE